MIKIPEPIAEPALELLGFRKLGAKADFGDIDVRDFTLPELPLIRKSTNISDINLNSHNALNQWNTSRCTAYTAAAVCMDIISLYHGIHVTIEGDLVWDLMKADGYCLDNGEGAYLRDAFKSIIHHGVLDTNGGYWTFEKFIKVEKWQWREAITKGFSLGTGSNITHPMMAADGFVHPVNIMTGTGHAYKICGLLFEDLELVGDMKNDPEYWRGLNSWGYWGERVHGVPHGGFKVADTYQSKMFIAFTLLEPKLS